MKGKPMIDFKIMTPREFKRYIETIAINDRTAINELQANAHEMEECLTDSGELDLLHSVIGVSDLWHEYDRHHGLYTFDDLLYSNDEQSEVSNQALCAWRAKEIHGLDIEEIYYLVTQCWKSAFDILMSTNDSIRLHRVHDLKHLVRVPTSKEINKPIAIEKIEYVNGFFKKGWESRRDISSGIHYIDKYERRVRSLGYGLDELVEYMNTGFRECWELIKVEIEVFEKQELETFKLIENIREDAGNVRDATIAIRALLDDEEYVKAKLKFG